MTIAAKQTFANKVFMDASPTAAVTLVGELLDFNPPRGARATEDVTTHDSAGGAQEFMAEGIYDPGELTLTMHHIDGSTTDLAFTTALATGALQNVMLRLKAATGSRDWFFSGYVTDYGPEAQPIRGKQTATATLKVTGAITKAVTAP